MTLEIKLVRGGNPSKRLSAFRRVFFGFTVDTSIRFFRVFCLFRFSVWIERKPYFSISHSPLSLISTRGSQRSGPHAHPQAVPQVAVGVPYLHGLGPTPRILQTEGGGKALGIHRHGYWKPRGQEGLRKSTRRPVGRICVRKFNYNWRNYNCISNSQYDYRSLSEIGSKIGRLSVNWSLCVLPKKWNAMKFCP